MQITHLRTSITREKLKHYIMEPDKTDCKLIDHVQETTEPYYLSAVELLNAIINK